MYLISVSSLVIRLLFATASLKIILILISENPNGDITLNYFVVDW